ncbi:hypothetical protein HCR18_03805 [Wolbachia pipientis]|nr:hypothetical protein [Wolbachia pipientis]MBA8770372.1 hypothetical protein [Wolbachia pipientis]
MKNWIPVSSTGMTS